MLEDIAILTDGKAIMEDVGIKLEKMKIEDLGRAKKVVIDKDNTTIVEGAGSASAIEGRIKQLAGNLTGRLAEARRDLEHKRSTLRRLSPQARVTVHRQQVDDLVRQAARAVLHGLALRRSALAGLQARVAALSPLATLERGFAIVRRRHTGEVVRRVHQVQAGDALTIRVQDGEFGATTRNGS